MGETEGQQLLTVKGIAACRKRRPTAIDAWIHDGQLLASKVGKEWRVRRAALSDFLHQSENRAARP